MLQLCKNMLKEFTMLYVINILYYLIADLDLLLVISCYSKLCYGVKIVLSQDEYLLPTTSKPLIYLCFLRSYNYTPTKSVLIFLVKSRLFYFQSKTKIDRPWRTAGATPLLKSGGSAIYTKAPEGFFPSSGRFFITFSDIPR